MCLLTVLSTPASRTSVWPLQVLMVVKCQTLQDFYLYLNADITEMYVIFIDIINVYYTLHYVYYYPRSQAS